MAYKYREDLVGKRFLSVSSVTKINVNKVTEWGWKAGVIRAASLKDNKNKELQVLVEYDGVDWQRREWVAVYSRRTFRVFLVERTLVWAPRTVEGKDVKWPALTFTPLAADVTLQADAQPVEFLHDQQLQFLNYASLQPYQEWDALLAGSDVSVDHAVLSNEAVEWRNTQDGQRILTTTPSVLGGCRAQVYRVAGATQWYTAVIVGVNEHTGELTVTDDTVLEEHSEDPALVQMRLLGDGVIESIMRGEVVGVMPRRSRSNLQRVDRENTKSPASTGGRKKAAVKSNGQIATTEPPPTAIAAEKQRRYEEKLKQDPEKYKEYKRKNRKNYHAKKRLVKDLTPKEKTNARVIWQLRKRELRQKKKNLNQLLNNTPPSSPSLIQEQDLQDPPLRNNTPRDSPIPTKKKRGRKKANLNRAKVFKKNLKLNEEIEKFRKKCDKYKKRYQRIEKLYKPKKEPKPDEKIKYKKLTNAIKERYQHIKKKHEKRLFKSIFENIDGCAKEEMITEYLGIQGQLRTKAKNRESVTELKKTLHDFFVRDDISRATSGKKETKTKGKIKSQKRFLLDSMKNLYKIFKQEKPDTRCSYYYFTQNKPFFVVKPSIDGREMCLCKLHVNPAYKAQVFKRKRVINTEDLNVLISSTVCDTKNHACMYGNCQKCGRNEVRHDTSKDNENIKRCEWGRRKEIYEKDGKRTKAVKNVKDVKEGRTKDLMVNFNKELKI